MKKILKIIAILIAAAVIYSLVPAAALYLQKDPAPYTNDQAVEKLKANTGSYFEFIVLGDNHAGLVFNDSASLKLIRNINREGRFKKVPIDFVEISGDVTLNGSARDYKNFNKIRSLIKMPVICAIGNHDNEGDGLNLFKKYMGSDELAYSNRNSYFIVLNNSKGDFTAKQFSDLEEELKKSLVYSHRFIFMHKPPLSPYQQSWYGIELGPWSYPFMKLCEKYKVDMVFTGHEHIFRELNHGGVKYITSGSGGIITQFPKEEGGFLHYTVVRVYGDYVDYEVRRISPPLWELLVYYMWKDAFYFLKGIIL